MNLEPSLPIPISYIAGNYFVFSIDAVTYLRREHHICGVLMGTLPQCPQQNVFLGLPLELMPEEARLLVEKGVACIVDEIKAQKHGMKALMAEDRKKYLHELESQGLQAMRLQHSRKEQQKEMALKKIEDKKLAKAKKMAEKQATAETQVSAEETQADPMIDLFADSQPSSSTPAQLASRPASIASSSANVTMGVTPATAHPPLPLKPADDQLLPLPEVPSSYPLFSHLHAEGYFLSPGLRFGCQYVAYPGDPLRFHSHFVVVSYEWDEEMDLMDLISGGRLGTGVKKGFLVGGAEKKHKDIGEQKDTVRTFSLEWAGM
ncbi:tRNA-splicing endonuclease subunit [Aspergillus nanangensis]|uniref:tRNA-splicing endonuclease subunit Sen34 n=1 Tax=Aspergillus nanangensis TaxID=2582783 RepID=A0AAD4H0G4_ASPNN|nr:tRNA-splicing endonuclease subunit [Aspergillus nanangensis]